MKDRAVNFGNGGAFVRSKNSNSSRRRHENWRWVTAGNRPPILARIARYIAELVILFVRKERFVMEGKFILSSGLKSAKIADKLSCLVVS